MDVRPSRAAPPVRAWVRADGFGCAEDARAAAFIRGSVCDPVSPGPPRPAAEGWTVSVNTVAVVMAELGLSGRKPPKRRSSTRQGKRPVARDLVRRNFDAVAPDVLWCGGYDPACR
jgi:hypothetical protein